MFLLTSPWSHLRYQYPEEGDEYLYHDRDEQLPRSLLYLVHQFATVLSNFVTDLGATQKH